MKISCDSWASGTCRYLVKRLTRLGKKEWLEGRGGEEGGHRERYSWFRISSSSARAR